MDPKLQHTLDDPTDQVMQILRERIQERLRVAVQQAYDKLLHEVVHGKGVSSYERPLIHRNHQ